MYFLNKKHVWLVEIKKKQFFEEKNRKYYNMLLLEFKL